MAFFTRNFCNSAAANNNASFAPLFRLLDDFDSYSRQSTRQSNIVHWQPKFDVRETEQAYELHGEFPGVNKEDVHLEFTQPETLVIRGSTERNYTSGGPSAGLEDSNGSGAIEKTGDEKSDNSHQATVENEFEPVSHETDQAIEKGRDENAKQVKDAQAKPTDNAKYWLTERTVGEFSRSFSFPTRIDQGAVTADFNNGILTVVVPKAKKHEPRRVAVL